VNKGRTEKVRVRATAGIS